MLEKLPKHPLLEYHTNTLSYVRSLYDLDSPGRMDEAIDKLDDWIKKQPYFTKTEYPREYLERMIISCKGSVERAKRRIEKVCMFRTLWSHWMQDPNIMNIKQNKSKFLFAALPKLTIDNYRVIIIKTFGSMDTKTICDIYRGFLIFTEHMKAHDYSTGFIYVIDYTETDLVSILSSLNPLELKELIDVTIEGFGVRIKGIHIYTQSKLIETLVRIFKNILSEKIGSRISVNRDLESLHKVISKEYLPKDYGGEEKSITDLRDEWLEVLSSEKNIEYQKEMNTACIIQARMPRNEQGDSTLGIPGTFRTLTLD